MTEKDMNPEKDIDKERDINLDSKEIKEENGKKKTAEEQNFRKETDGEENEQEDSSESKSHEEALEHDGEPDKEACENGDGSGTGKKKDEKDLKIDELTDKWKRLMAEFENFRKRTEMEKSAMYSEGARTVLEKILPVIDNFERASASVPEELKESSYVDGMEKIYRQFTEVLKNLGVTPIEAVGKEFDANLHNAVMHTEDPEKGENEVVEELQKGYMYKDKVLRYSMVKVAN